MPIITIALIKFFDLLTWIILIQCLMSWFPEARMSRIYEILSMITEPIMGPIRNILFRYIDIPIDFSPIVAFFLISMVKKIVIIIGLT